MAEQNEFQLFKNRVEQSAVSDPEIRTLLDELCESMIIKTPGEGEERTHFSSPGGYGVIETFAILFLYHVLKDVWAYGRAWMALSLAEKQARVIKSLTDKGMDKETATALVDTNMKVLAQRPENDEAVSKLIALSGKEDKDK